MDIEFLKTFLEVNHTRHFGKAAENLFITQSTVSARIRHLEETVGTALFIRARNDIRLTAAGERLVYYAESIATTWNRARQEIAVAEEQRVPITVASTPSLWDIYLRDWLHSNYQHYSQLVLHLEIFTQDIMLRRLLDGTLDLAFMFDLPQMSDLNFIETPRIPLVMVSSLPQQRVAEALQQHYILVDWGNTFATTHARNFPDMPSPAMYMGQGRMARDYLLSCGGAAYLAKPMVQEHLDSAALFLVEDAPVIERPAYAAYTSYNDKQSYIEQILGYFEGDKQK